MTKNTQALIKQYYCKKCNRTHQVKISDDLIHGQTNFPVPYIFLHGDLRNFLTTLYLDKHLQIRGVEVHELSDDDIFSKDHVLKLTNTLIKEIERLRKENAKMSKTIFDLNNKINEVNNILNEIKKNEI